MKMQHCIREADSIITVADTVYHFAANTRGELVAEVADDHVEVLLKDPAFLVYTIDGPPDGADDDDEDADEPDDSGEFGAPVDETPEVQAAEDKYLNQTMDELRAEFEARFGRKAPPAMKHETIVLRLARDDQERSHQLA